MTAEKILENRLRRVAKRRGYTLLKSRARDPLAVTFGGFMLVDQNNVVVLGSGNFPYNADLAEVAEFFDLNKKEAARKKKK
jgi:hypothetical protein